MKRLLIIGSKGMAGHVIYNYFKAKKGFEVIDVSRNDDYFTSDFHCDISDTKSLSEILDKSQPDFVINCIGILNDDAESHPDKAIFYNSYFPHYLAGEGIKNNFKLIHISTDCVFSGSKGSYEENDEKDGKGFYAKSKALGEVTYEPHLTIRTSIIGPELKDDGIGLFNWFMNQQGNVKGYDQAFWGGVTTLELAKAIEEYIDSELTGLVHLTNNVRISKYELLSIIKKVFEREDLLIHADHEKKVDKSLISTRSDVKNIVPGYEEMINELYDMMSQRSEVYNKYFPQHH